MNTISTTTIYAFFSCEPINGILGAKKYPVKLANRMGTKCPKPVRVANRMVVLIGVRVTQALMAAIQLTMAKVGLIEGINWCRMRPKVAHTKKSGMINLPRQPDVTVMEMATISKRRMANSSVKDKLLDRSALISWCPK